MENSDFKIKEENSILIGRHLEDVDDLTEGLDTELKALSPEGHEIINSNAESIIQNTLAKKMTKVILVSSPRKRSYSTSFYLKDVIKEKTHGVFSVLITKDDRFTEISHGEIILPDNYVPGKRIDFLKDAWKIFWSETFTEDGNYNNPNYRFGDPVKLADGGFKHGEIKAGFKTYGESYRELCERYYNAIVEYLENKNRVESKGFNVVLIAHSATLGILTELVDVSHDLSNKII